MNKQIVAKGEIMLTENGYNTGLTLQTAEQAKHDAEVALGKIQEFAGDNKISPMEKRSLLVQWQEIQKEYPNYIKQSDEFEIDTALYRKRYTELDSFLKPLFINMAGSSDVDTVAFKNIFANYYQERVNIVTLIQHFTKQLAIQAEEVGQEAIDLSKIIEEDVAGIKDDTTPEKMIENVIGSEDFQSKIDEKANAEDLENLVTEEQLEDETAKNKEYIDAVEAGMAESVNEVERELVKTKDSIVAQFSLAKGVNLLRNSTGWFGTDFFGITGILRDIGNGELEELGIGHAFHSPLNEKFEATQSVVVQPDTDYSISTWIKTKIKEQTNIQVFDGTKRLFILGNGASTKTDHDYNLYINNFVTGIDTNELTIKFISSVTAEGFIAGTMLNEGPIALQWTQHSQEIANTNVQLNLNGIKVIGDNGGYTIMSPKEFSGYATVIDPDTNKAEEKRVFTLNGDTTEVAKLQAESGFNMGSIMIFPIDFEDNKGWAFVKS